MGVGWESLLRIGAEKAPISVGTGRASLDIVIEKNGAKTVHFEGYPEFISGIEVAVVASRRLLVLLWRRGHLRWCDRWLQGCS